MRTAALAIALLMSGAAIAQTTQPDLDVDADVGVHADGDLDVDADVDADMNVDTNTPTTQTSVAHDTTVHSMASMTTPASGQVVAPSNADPERDARGIAVISAAAVVPAGWNGVSGTAVGGPLVDPVSGETVDAADDSYPACTASVTDNCLQAYERGRSPR